MSQATLGEAPYRNSNLFTNYYLDNRVHELDQWNVDDEAEAAFERLRSIWEAESDLLASYGEDELLDVWIDEVLDELGYATLSETTLPDGGGYTDRLLFDSREERAEAARRRQDGETEAMFGSAAAVLEAKQWDASFTERFSEQRSYRDASHQIKYYLEHTPEATEWGILTNGRQWRLYGTKDYATETYYEVNLPELLERGDLEAFKYFYTFFRPTAFADAGGSTFLDTVWNESETAAQELGEDLQDSVFTALRVLAEGFVETNDLDIDPDDDERLAKLKEQSLVYLYRLMFVLYAESRHLLDPEDPDKRAEYREHFGLNQLRREVYESVSEGKAFDDFSRFSTSYWGRLDDLFGLIDTGEADLDVPPYNGGLFDADDHAFLADNEVADRYLAEVLYRIGTTEDADGSDVLADYADLDTRHLGSIYEGLLEHEFRIAPEQYAAVAEDGGQVWQPATEVSVADAVETVEAGELYVVNDDGERKATGAYYTPDYVVTYIVEETVDPLLAEIDADLRADGLAPSDREYFRRYWESVLELTILDPAMGSGHFLTKATGYLTERVMAVVREQEIQGYDEQALRREIAKECIYGVDVNGMAVELAKLSMWLETLAADKPLAFLDHHLKSGNSLVGSDIYEVLSDDDPDDGQLTLMQSLARVRDDTLAHVRELMEELVAIDNDDLASIKEMEATYDEIRSDPLYRRLFELANVHTAERFGLDVPAGAYETMAGAIETESEWTSEVVKEDWFVSAQAMAKEEQFFHWELEFPEVFVGGAREDGLRGFDGIVGNPPWGAELPERAQDYVTEQLGLKSSASDTFAAFTKLSARLCHTESAFGMILPSGWQTSDKYASFREWTVENYSLNRIVNLPYDVFEDAYVDSSVFIFEMGAEQSETELGLINYDRKEQINGIDDEEDGLEFIDYSRWFSEDLDPGDEFEFISYLSSKELDIEQKVAERGIPLGEVADVQRGITPFDLVEEQGPNHSPGLDGELRRYRYSFSGEKYVEYHEGISEFKPERYFEGDRLILRELISRQFRLQLVRTEQDFVTNKSYQSILLDDENYDLGFLLGVLNSKLLAFYHIKQSAVALRDDFPKIVLSETRSLPIPELTGDTSTDLSVNPENVQFDSETDEIRVNDETTVSAGPNSETAHVVSELTNHLMELRSEYGSLNLDLLSYLGEYRSDPTVDDLGFVQVCEEAAGSVIQKTTEQHPKLKAGSATVEVESDSTVVIKISARFKPDDSNDVETDRWGYTETDHIPALRVTDLSPDEVTLLANYVPVAVDEELSNFRQNATTSDSLVDRLLKLKLPKLDDVSTALDRYSEVASRGEKLETQILGVDDTLDRIVYEVFGLSPEEVRVVENSSIDRKLVK